MSQIVCPGCQQFNEPNTNFCGACGVDLRPRRSSGRVAAMDPWLGRLIDNRWRVLERLGQGGMGVVYKVEHQRMGKIAAMKVLHRELAGEREVVKRFCREAEAVSKLTHPNTVQTFDFGTPGGAMYLVMEYVRGEDLGAILRRDGPLALRRSVPVFVQIAGALAEAHELGIVHRDLKPENILVTRTREGHDFVKVLDFGLAKLAEREEAPEVTERGAIVGTPYYMSPEQIRGELLDHRSDIYSLGAMMYRVVTGEHPFNAQSPIGVLTKHLTDEVVPPRVRRPDLDIEPSLESIVLRAMAKRREARYPTVDDLRQELEQVWNETVSSSGRLELSRDRDRTPPPGSGVATGPTHTPVAIAGRVEPRNGHERRGSEDRAKPEQRLAREEFDAFERSLRRRSRLRVVGVPLGLAVLGVAGTGFVVWERRQPRTVESEPNDDAENATLVAVGKPVSGRVGQRRDVARGDRDTFRVRLPSLPDGSSGKLSLRLTAIGNMDLAVQVLSGGRTQLAHVDNLGIGAPETLPNLAVTDDEAYVAVFESTKYAGNRGPTENITDRYVLTVGFEAFTADEEREPNDLEVEATVIGPGTTRGTLGRLGDVDRYALTGPAGTYEVGLDGPEGVSARLRVGDQIAEAGRTRVEHAERTIIAIERIDPPPSGGSRPLARGVEQGYRLAIAHAR